MQYLNEHTAAVETAISKNDREQLFNCLYTGLYEKIVGCTLYYCRDEEMAKDLTQDVFMRVWDQIDRLIVKLGGWSNWESYLYIMAKNQTLNYRKKLATEVKGKSSYYKNADTVVRYDVMLEKECEQLFNQALQQLTHRQSEVYLLNQHGVERDTIAEKLGITYSTVSNTLNNARQRMKVYVCERLELGAADREWLPAA
jgi:RNA polymerase sigma-70 factor (ECF subfamily)